MLGWSSSVRYRKSQVYYGGGLHGDVLCAGTVIVVEPSTATYKVQMETPELGILTFSDNDVMVCGAPHQQLPSSPIVQAGGKR